VEATAAKDSFRQKSSAARSDFNSSMHCSTQRRLVDAGNRYGLVTPATGATIPVDSSLPDATPR